MIIESHLRIGNFIARNDSKDFIISEVLGINRNFEWEYLIDSRNSDGRHRESLWISSKKCDPIPLTPEWLERCGLELRKKDKIWQIQVGNTSYLEIEAEEPFMCGVTPETWRGLCPIYIWNEIKHVHQLQNLYFALAGEELNVKL